MTNRRDRSVGDVYDPNEGAPGRPPEQGAGAGAKERGAGAWPAAAYEPAEPAGVGSVEPDTLSPHPGAGDPALARLLLDHLRESRSEAVPAQGTVLSLEAPDLRARVLDRLERELEASGPELLVATGPGAIEVGAPLADRTDLPLIRESAVPGDPARWPDVRVAVVGSVLRPAAIADVLRAVEARGATIVSILGVAVRDREDTELLYDHYNMFFIIRL